MNDTARDMMMYDAQGIAGAFAAFTGHASLKSLHGEDG
ncbi:hypothetical protein LMG28138_03369 [Pararobbsia alpina]|uniref:Uncharacterized protein n=1 Tax=Pararobbsia alpina TaxID=621374 RepID=A0A6S7BBH8_9BURK|nr:hypothetical protein LMG28138_03369 [Pararobbsia alpina]